MRHRIIGSRRGTDHRENSLNQDLRRKHSRDVSTLRSVAEFPCASLNMTPGKRFLRGRERSSNDCFPSRVVPASRLDTNDRQPYGKEIWQRPGRISDPAARSMFMGNRPLVLLRFPGAPLNAPGLRLWNKRDELSAFRRDTTLAQGVSPGYE